VHRFGLGNALGWLRDRQPPGRAAFSGIQDAVMDAAWRNFLERQFRGDYLYATLVRT
jgi:hypothetical protein